MIEKTVKIGDTDVKFRSSASVPRLYRIKFGRDIFKDLSRLEKFYKEKAVVREANQHDFDVF